MFSMTCVVDTSVSTLWVAPTEETLSKVVLPKDRPATGIEASSVASSAVVGLGRLSSSLFHSHHW